MNILLCTGIFPPQIGGPSQYVKNLRDEWQRQGHSVKVLTYKLEKILPTGIRHLLFFMRTVASLWKKDFVIALDTYSVGFPAVLVAKLFGKKVLIRTGGDFLWESYVERTGDMVLLRKFYENCLSKFNLKEKIIFRITKWTLRSVSALIFSSAWQRDIWMPAYSLDEKKCHVVENFYGEKTTSVAPDGKIFVAGSRKLKLKNTDRLNRAFAQAKESEGGLTLDFSQVEYGKFFEKISHSYAVIAVSISEVSPNMILDSIRAGKPFIVTREVGIYDRLKNIGIFVDPEDEEDIKNKILFLADLANYEMYKRKVESFSFTHTWKEICSEIIQIARHA